MRQVTSEKFSPDSLWQLAKSRGLDFGGREKWREKFKGDRCLRDADLLKELVFHDPEILTTLLPREKDALTLVWGLDRAEPASIQDIASNLNVTRERSRQIISKALLKLGSPDRVKILLSRYGQSPDSFKERVSHDDLPITLQDVLSTISRLTPDLVKYLKSSHDEIVKFQSTVFEELVAELFSSYGYQVALVGQNARTAADIFVVTKPDTLGISQRYFVEVKKWKARVGIEVIEKVHGARLAEQEEYGWTAAVIVSSLGFRRFKRYSRRQLVAKGIHLRDRSDLLKWLEGYKPHKSGLWLPQQKLKLL